LQQAIRLLQLSTLEVNQESDRLLDENPFLEREEDDPGQPYAYGDANTQTAAMATRASTSERTPNGRIGRSLLSPLPANALMLALGGVPINPACDHLISQVNLSLLEERDRQIIGLLIDALDDNAYLSQPLEEIAEFLPPELDITLDDLETALVQLQHLDEPGIGARNLSECLSLQLQALSRHPDCNISAASLSLAQRLVASHLDLLAATERWPAKTRRLVGHPAIREIIKRLVEEDHNL
jgi:RNA polymerase sigma-54 factor